LDSNKEEWLDRLTTFNLNARYDSYEQDFYKLCTEEFAILYFAERATLNSFIKESMVSFTEMIFDAINALVPAKAKPL